MNSSETPLVAFVCPGQGAHDSRLVESLACDPFFLSHRDLAGDIAGEDVLERARREGPAYLRRNEVASLLVVMAACAWRERLSRAGIAPHAVAGYSVGQWTAMHFAGMLDLPSVLHVVWQRAQAMNRQASLRAGAMLGVIGLALGEIQAACEAVSQDGLLATISNINCVGQVTVAGDSATIDQLHDRLRGSARKLVRMNVSGAWHCPLMEPAAEALAPILDRITLHSPSLPVADNTTGGQLPTDPALLRQSLLRHLHQPVLWQENVRWLATLGATRFVEAGHGDTLTKFGFFIDRRREHVAAETLWGERPFGGSSL